MLKVGLTGGIGSGKSEAERLFAALDVPTLDTDVIAREVVEPDTPGLDLLIKTFGQQIVLPNGQLNREQLRNIVFADSNKRKKLENLLHPLIRAALNKQLDRLVAPYVIIAIPLLFESSYNFNLDRILVIDVSQELQHSRVSQRDKLDSRTVQQIINAQVKRRQRLVGANDIIVNDGSLSDLTMAVKRLHQRYNNYNL